MSEQTGPIYSPEAYAGFIRRTLALAIDAAILVTLWVTLPWLWYSSAPPVWVTMESYVWLYAGLIVFAFAYLFGFRLTTGGTPGYRIVRIRYAYMLSGRPSLATIMFRSILALFLLWFFALDHLWILFDERKQAWHDKVSGFYVVKCSAQPVGTTRIVQRVINFMMLSFVVWEPLHGQAGAASAAASR